MPSRFLAIAISLLTAFQPVHAEPPTALPDDERGQCVRLFLETTSRPTAETVAAFEAACASAERRATRSPEAVWERAADLHRVCGRVEMERVLAITPGTVIIALRQDRGDPTAVEFQFSETEPGKLDHYTVSPLAAAAIPVEIDAETRAGVVRSAARLLEKHYVFPEKGEAMARHAREQLESGAYEGIKDEATLAARLTRDFRSISNDKHLRVRLSPAPDPLAMSSSTSPAAPAAAPPAIRESNSGFKKVEVLEGNIGYVRFDHFENSEDARQTAAAAMAFVSRCDAVIFDMRRNGGGSPEMVRFITSYLVDERTHLNDMVDRKDRTVEEFWTMDDMPGRKIGARPPVFVLTSSYTFSGAEEFTYNLKSLKRAMVVGETTGGGAHPVRGTRVDDRFVMMIPYMRARNPITQTNWEGTGVAPDIACSADEALDRAHEAAMRAIAEK